MILFAVHELVCRGTLARRGSHVADTLLSSANVPMVRESIARRCAELRDKKKGALSFSRLMNG